MNKRYGVILSLVVASAFGTGFVFGNNVFADDSEFSVTLTPSAGITLSKSSAAINIDPTIDGLFSSDSVTVTAYTNSPDGYELYLSANPVALTSSTIDATTGDPYTIPAVTEACTENAFEMNHWGVKIGSDTTFDAPGTSAQPSKIKEKDEPVNGETTTVTFGTKLDLGTVPGTYTSSINFSVVAKIDDPFPDPGSINDSSPSSTGHNYPANSLLRAYEIAYTKARKPMYIETSDTTHYPTGWKPMEDGDTGDVRFAMQDIDMTFTEDNVTHSVCEWAEPSWANFTYVTSTTPNYYEMTTNYIDRALVMDLRDGKSYWIIKHGDGKCWMAQNLDFDLQQGVALTSDTTALYQINDGFNLYTSSTGYSQDGTTGVISWTPTGGTLVPENGSVTVPSSYTTEWSGVMTPYAIDPGNYYWRNTPWHSSNGGVTYGSQEFLDKFSATSFGNPDPRDGTETHIGNTYNWGAAGATNKGGLFAENYSTESNLANNPQNSICPKGWRLPIINNVVDAGDEDSDTPGFQSSNEFYNLFVTYGLVNGTFNDYDMMNNSQNESDNDKIAVIAPFYFTRAGEGLLKMDDEGNYWTSTLAGSWECGQGEGDCAATFRIRSGFIEQYSVYDHMNDSMFSIRCIAR